MYSRATSRYQELEQTALITLATAASFEIEKIVSLVMQTNGFVSAANTNKYNEHRDDELTRAHLLSGALNGKRCVCFVCVQPTVLRVTSNASTKSPFRGGRDSSPSTANNTNVMKLSKS